MTDDAKIIKLRMLALSMTPDNVGDVYMQAVDIYNQIYSAAAQQIGEFHVAQIRSLARQAEIGWRLFKVTPATTHSLTDDEAMRIVTIVGTLHAFCYGAERLDEASFVAGPDSTPVRFYINSLYHYIAALYLLDKGNHRMGGMAYKTLLPMGLAYLLDPIRGVLDKNVGNRVTFGETIRRIRNDFLVHGTFSPSDVAAVVGKTRLRDPKQLLRLTNLIWELFNQSFVLKLKLIALLTTAAVDLDTLVAQYQSNHPPS